MKAVLVLLPMLALGAAAQDSSTQQDRELIQLQNSVEQLARLAKQAALQRSVNGAVMGPTVTGAPYSGLETVETSQTLGDGTHINRTTKTMVYRDSEGRIRRETPDYVTILDPVAGVSYALDPKAQTARKMPLGLVKPLRLAGNGSIGVSFPPSDTDRARTLLKANGVTEGVIVEGVAPGSPAEKAGMQSGDVIIGVNGRPIASGNDLAAAISGMSVGASVNVTALRNDKVENFPMAIANRTMVFPGVDSPVEQAGPLQMLFTQGKASDKTESLGQQTIEGINAEGTQVTSTIETGEIGNDRPIQTVSERWYSPDLKTDVKVTRSDPRTGQEAFTLTNIVRAEPSPDLFQVPASYRMVGPK
jgi:membrane-associated protease RseP (regulator of RpoE activity)